MELNVFLQPDDNYAPFAGVTITSLFENNKHFDRITVYILSIAMNEDNQKRFRELAQKYNRELEFIDVNSVMDFLKKYNVPKYSGTLAAYVKLFAVSLFQKKMDTLIYIDADMIINGKMDALVQLDFDGKPCAMVVDRTCDYYKKGIGMKEEDVYYNAGLIVFNVPVWKEQRCEEQLREHVEHVRAAYPFCDQDLINMVHSKNTKRIDIRYNYNTDIVLYNNAEWYCKIYDTPENYYTIEEIEQDADKVIIYHCFESIASRPWFEKSSFPNPKKELWDYYLKKSTWNDYVGCEKKFPLYIRLQTIGYKVLPKSMYAKLCKCFLHKRMKQRLEL